MRMISMQTERIDANGSSSNLNPSPSGSEFPLLQNLLLGRLEASDLPTAVLWRHGI